jgi:hypothetical protein
MKIPPVGASCYMPTDGWTDMTNLIVAFRNFANATEIYIMEMYFSKIVCSLPVCRHVNNTGMVKIANFYFQ